MEKIDTFPDVLRIEPSGACNFKCTHCANAQLGHSRGRMSLSTLDAILCQLKLLNYVPRVVVLYHGGEPLMNIDIGDFVRRFVELGSFVKIVSNASLLSDKIADNLLDSGLNQIEFSFDGVSPEENNRIRCNGDFLRDSQNVINILYKNKLNPRKLNVCISNTQILARDEAITHNNKKTLSIPPYIKERFKDFQDVQYSSFPAMLWPSYDTNKSLYQVVNTKVVTNNYCSSLFETITITSNGSVVPCCFDICGDTVFGNINEDNIFNIWKNKAFSAFRKSIKNGTLNFFCKRCLNFTGEYLVKAG